MMPDACIPTQIRLAATAHSGGNSAGRQSMSLNFCTHCSLCSDSTDVAVDVENHLSYIRQEYHHLLHLHTFPFPSLSRNLDVSAQNPQICGSRFTRQTSRTPPITTTTERALRHSHHNSIAVLNRVYKPRSERFNFAPAVFSSAQKLNLKHISFVY
ncbi:hypothetical protein PUMCH_001461 [Australozyma saopauloensis]|uniref:Uncharacterized protein n=1 Tax=Australozyma saopauloensis TaxID=291208 RepID=A0AAX4H6R4_9ASCO|nr:hypothetical protein PUMCH_001461 [[Candida] saopauloensis]